MRVKLIDSWLRLLTGLPRSDRTKLADTVEDDSGGEVSSLEVHFGDRVERPVEDVATPPFSLTIGDAREESVASQVDVNETVPGESVKLVLPVTPALEVEPVPSEDVAEPEIPDNTSFGESLVLVKSPSLTAQVQQVSPPVPAKDRDMVVVAPATDVKAAESDLDTLRIQAVVDRSAEA